MIKNGKGGGNTKTGLVFEGKVDLSTFLSHQPHYSIKGHDVYFDNEKVARVYLPFGKSQVFCYHLVYTPI